MTARLAVVSVTYGDRSCFLRQVAERVLALAVNTLVVVDNASSPATKQYLCLLKAQDERVRVVTLNENQGSAGGYKVGLAAAMQTDCDHIWLLDDDNVPEPDALTGLVQHYHALSTRHATDKLALMCLREDRVLLKRVACGMDPADVFPRPASFLGLHARDLFAKLLRLGRTIPVSEKVAGNDPIAIPYGPYGGLFFHREVLAQVGYPNPALFVYADDYDFTQRFVRAGGTLYLVSGSRVVDVDTSWHVKRAGSIFTKLLRDDSDFRVYYAVRNQVYLETRQCLPRHLLCRSLYHLNKLAFSALLYLEAARGYQQGRLALFRRAVRDGERAHLGIVEGLT